MLGHNTSHNKFKKIEIVSSIISNHNGTKLEINYKKKTKILKYVEIKEHAIEQPVVKEEIKIQFFYFLIEKYFKI